MASTTTTTLTMNSSTPSLPVVFITQTPYGLPTQKFMIPASWKRYQLSQLINQTLKLPRPVPFDFLLESDGSGREILRGSLGEWCKEKGVGEEETLRLEYIESVLPPEKISEFPHEDWVSSVSCQLSGHFLTACYDGHIRSFDYSNPGHPTCAMRIHSAAATSISIVHMPSLDTSTSTENNESTTVTIASGSHDLTARLSKLTISESSSHAKQYTMTPLASLHLHTAPVASVASNLSGTHLVTASWDGLVGIWDTSIPSTDEVLEEEEKSERDRKKRRKIADEKKESIRRKAPVGVLKSHIGRVSKAMFARGEGKTAYSCGFDSTVRVWDVELGVCTHTINASEKPFLDLTPMEEDPSTVLVSSTDRTMCLYDVRVGESSSRPITFMHNATPSCVTTASHQQVLSGAYDGTVRLWDLRSTKSAIASFRGDGKVLSVDWMRGVVGVGGEGGLTVWKVQS